MHKHFSQKGFTLIELILVMAIIALVFLATIPNFMQNAARQRMLRVATSILTEIRGAQSIVLTGEVYGQAIDSGVGVDILRDSNPDDGVDQYGVITVFINKDGDPFFSNTTRTCSEVIPVEGVCTQLCGQCLFDAELCGPLVTQDECSGFIRSDFPIKEIELGTRSTEVDLGAVTIGKLRLLNQDGSFDGDAEYNRVLLHFASPKADARILGIPNGEVDLVGTPDEYFRMCMEIKARIGQGNQGVLTRTLYFDRIGGFIRMYTDWPEDVCSAYDAP